MKRITYNKFGTRMGRLGNSILQLAALYGMSRRWNRQLVLPEWNYQQYFKYKIPIIERGDFKNDICENVYHFPGWEYWDKEESKQGQLMSISGWLQASKYWSKYREEVLSTLFEFKEDFKKGLQDRFKYIFKNGKPTILIGIRVGEDYVSNGNYEILPILYQISALWKHFPNWREEYNILVFSDDYEYAKLNLDCDSERIFFAEGLSDIEQLYLGTLCQHFVVPNSTFSICQALLGEKKESVVIRPSKYFKGYLEETSDTKDLWEKRWIEHDYRGEKLDCKDVTFNIPVKYDHPDRMENMKMVEEWVWRNFDTKIIVGEQETNKFRDGTYKYMHFNSRDMDSFHRTRMLNTMAEMSETPCIINFDCDNIVPIMQMMIGVDMLRRGAEMVYPYDGRVARVERGKWRPLLMNRGIDCGVFKGVMFKGTRPIDPKSVGHIIMWNKEKFFEIGGENENFISYGPEDVERWERAEKLGVRIERVKGICYHIDHYIGADSSGGNKHFGANYKELERIRKLSKDQLLEDIKTWNKEKGG